jgi:uncharacterized membrane protein
MQGSGRGASDIRREDVPANPSRTNTQKNISAVSAMEHEALAARSCGQRLGDVIARSAGQMWFIVGHAVWFGVWIGLNCGVISGLRPFDPFPFQFLTFVVSLEAIFLSLFILMSQNRSNSQAEARAHLDLQINLLSEQESTKMLQMLRGLCRHHGLAEGSDPEAEHLELRTEPEDLLRELKESLPENC